MPSLYHLRHRPGWWTTSCWASSPSTWTWTFRRSAATSRARNFRVRVLPRRTNRASAGIKSDQPVCWNRAGSSSDKKNTWSCGCGSSVVKATGIKVPQGVQQSLLTLVQFLVAAVALGINPSQAICVGVRQSACLQKKGGIGLVVNKKTPQSLKLKLVKALSSLNTFKYHQNISLMPEIMNCLIKISSNLIWQSNPHT